MTTTDEEGAFMPSPHIRPSEKEHEDAARVYPIARPVREWFGSILDAENRQIARSSPEYAVQIVHALNAPVSATGDIESMRVTLGCCLALMAQSGNLGCEEMARRIPFTIKNGEPYALVGVERTTKP